MKIIIGKNAGFCFGVKRAVEGSLNEIDNTKKVYCLGELVHNKEVINKIEKAGITVISNIDEIKEDNIKLIIRAHGIDKNIYDIAKKRNIEITDYTCPLVSKIHNIVEEYNNKGYYIILVGNKNHPEIIGTKSHCGDQYSTIESIDDIDNSLEELSKSNNKNLLLIVQTTYNKSTFKNIEDTIKDKIDSSINLVVKNTICNATELRQIETSNLAKEVDLMIIIGGKNSSNTKKLYDIASEYTDTLLIETSNEIDLNNINKYNKIGIMAGTSTPQESIDRVVDKLNSINML